MKNSLSIFRTYLGLVSEPRESEIYQRLSRPHLSESILKDYIPQAAGYPEVTHKSNMGDLRDL